MPARARGTLKLPGAATADEPAEIAEITATIYLVAGAWPTPAVS